MMKYVYLFLIFVSAVFNSVTQSIAYEAWTAGIPAFRIVEARGDIEAALFSLTLKELGEVKVSQA